MDHQKWQFIWDYPLDAGSVANRLASRGEQGWELVAATQSGDTWALFFKMPVVNR